MGTVIHLLKLHHGADCLRFNLEEEQAEIDELYLRAGALSRKMQEIKNG
jgi:hypothetical protein